MDSENYYFIWEHSRTGFKVKGIITYYNSKQFLEDELKINIEMMKAGYSLVRKIKNQA